MPINVKNCKNQRYYNTYRTTKSIANLCPRKNGIEEDALKIQELICVQQFARRVSTYFSVHLHIIMANMVVTSRYPCSVRACSHEPGTVNYPGVMIARGQALPRVHMMICCPGAMLPRVNFIAPGQVHRNLITTNLSEFL